MSNIYLKVTIEKKQRSRNFDFLKAPEREYIFSKSSWNSIKRVILLIFQRVSWNYLNNCLHVCVFMYVCF